MIQELVLVSLIVFIGGLVKGFSGFGYAVVGLGLLSMYYPADKAVIIMIAPLLLGNLTLANEIDAERLKHCLQNFWVFMSALLAGTLLGMMFIGSLPASMLSSMIGLFLIGYSAVRSGYFDSVLAGLKKSCFRRKPLFQSAAGFLGGAVFGSMSIGVLVVSYLEGIELDRKVFVGLLSFTFLIISGIRMLFSWSAGYYSGTGLLYISLLAGIPGIVGVKLGSRVDVPSRMHKKIVLALLLVIGLRLTIPG